MKSFFINEAFDKAINDYMSSKEKPDGITYNSFLVVIIRMLINIYGELDILNPYQIGSEEAFDSNLMKFGASQNDVDALKSLLSGFYLFENANREDENTYFIDLQKKLIDLFTLKRINFGITESDGREFFDLLYTPGTSNPLRISYNFYKTNKPYEIAEYYKNSMERKVESKKEEKKNLLNFDLYKLFNFSIADISKMNNEELDNINSQIYESLDINENAINKDYLLNEKIKNIKLQNEPLTTGNGYVDILLIMSVVVTSLMIIVIFSTIVF